MIKRWGSTVQEPPLQGSRNDVGLGPLNEAGERVAAPEPTGLDKLEGFVAQLDAMYERALAERLAIGQQLMRVQQVIDRLEAMGCKLKLAAE